METELDIFAFLAAQWERESTFPNLDERFRGEAHCFEAAESDTSKKWTCMGDLVGVETGTRHRVFAKLMLTSGERVKAKKFRFANDIHLDRYDSSIAFGYSDEKLEEVASTPPAVLESMAFPTRGDVVKAVKASRYFGPQAARIIGFSERIHRSEDGTLMNFYSLSLDDKARAERDWDTYLHMMFFDVIDGVPLSSFTSAKELHAPSPHPVIQEVKSRWTGREEVKAFKARIEQQLKQLYEWQLEVDFGQCDARPENYMVTLQRSDGSGLFDDVELVMCDFDLFGRGFKGKQDDLFKRWKSELTNRLALGPEASTTSSTTSSASRRRTAVVAPPPANWGDGTKSRDSEDSEDVVLGKRKDRGRQELRDITNLKRTKRTSARRRAAAPAEPTPRRRSRRQGKQTTWMNL